jgi:hypothetical protein
MFIAIPFLDFNVKKENILVHYFSQGDSTFFVKKRTLIYKYNVENN